MDTPQSKPVSSRMKGYHIVMTLSVAFCLGTGWILRSMVHFMPPEEHRHFKIFVAVWSSLVLFQAWLIWQYSTYDAGINGIAMIVVFLQFLLYLYLSYRNFFDPFSMDPEERQQSWLGTFLGVDVLVTIGKLVYFVIPGYLAMLGIQV